MSNIHRRQFLRGSSAMLMLPFLESLIGERAFAQAASSKRFVTMYMPNGTAMYHNQGANWFRSAAGALPTVAGQLPPIFAPFATQMSDVMIMRGIHNYESERTTFGGQHSQSISGFLTCAPATSNAASCTIEADSIDHAMATAMGNKPVMVLSGGGSADGRADATAYNYGEFLSYKNRNGVNPIKNPVALARTLVGATAVQTDLALARNPSVLDSLVGSISSLNKRLTASDKAKLDDYLTSLRALETKIKATPPTVPAGCNTAPTVAAALNQDDYYCNKADFPERLKAMMDMIVFAFKCDLHRVVTFHYDAETATRRLKGRIPTALLHNGVQLTDEENHIDVAHHEGNATKNSRCISRDRFYLSYLFYLMSQLKSATDAAGVPLLDNTLILSGFGIYDGNHSANNYSIDDFGMPLMLAGGRNLVNTGRQVHFAARSDQRALLLAISQKVGHNITTFRGNTKTLAL